MRSATLLALAPVAALAAPSVARRDTPAPLHRPREIREGKYIVKMKSDTMGTAITSAVDSILADADATFDRFGGFIASMTDAEVENMRFRSDVEYIEHDGIMRMSVDQEDATWGIARVSSQTPGSTVYSYDESAGEGTCSYVVDTGIDTEHPEFEGRAAFAGNFVDDNDADGQGHGTHVAGTIGSVTYGVAKKTQLFAVKVLGDDGSGTNSGVIQGMEFVITDSAERDCPNGVTVNMSLGGATSQAVNTAAASIVEAGLFLAVAAGNEASDASSSSPASEASACTVGSTTRNDTLSSFSNFGSLVDVLAPGSDITSTWPGGEVNTISGTSMASPHVAGLAAYLLGLGSSVEGLCEEIASSGLDVIKTVPTDTISVLINNGFSA